ASGALQQGGASGVPIELGEFGRVGTQPIDLYRRGELVTGSLSAVHIFGPTLGLDDLLLVGELAANHVPGRLPDTVNYAYLSSFSWGYTLNLTGTLEKAFAGIDLRPGLTYRQDVKGASPALSENFVEGRQ